MLGLNHLLISATATSLILNTASPTIIATGAIAGLLPDIDISTSPAGRVLPWISSFFEQKKGGGGKGGGQKKGPGSLADIPKPPEPWKDPEVIMENLLLVESFRRKVGRSVLHQC